MPRERVRSLRPGSASRVVIAATFPGQFLGIKRSERVFCLPPRGSPAHQLAPETGKRGRGPSFGGRRYINLQTPSAISSLLFHSPTQFLPLTQTPGNQSPSAPEAPIPKTPARPPSFPLSLSPTSFDSNEPSWPRGPGGILWGVSRSDGSGFTATRRCPVCMSLRYRRPGHVPTVASLIPTSPPRFRFDSLTLLESRRC